MLMRGGGDWCCACACACQVDVKNFVGYMRDGLMGFRWLYTLFVAVFVIFFC